MNTKPEKNNEEKESIPQLLNDMDELLSKLRNVSIPTVEKQPNSSNTYTYSYLYPTRVDNFFYLKSDVNRLYGELLALQKDNEQQVADFKKDLEVLIKNKQWYPNIEKVVKERENLVSVLEPIIKELKEKFDTYQDAVISQIKGLDKNILDDRVLPIYNKKTPTFLPTLEKSAGQSIIDQISKIHQSLLDESKALKGEEPPTLK